MAKEYDPKTLKAVQTIELEIFEKFIEICEKNHLTYFAFGGTGIGALRHKGFIPWDDDIDVALPRKDYEKFLEIAAKEYSDEFYILNAETDSNYPLATTRWCKKGTTFWEEALKTVPCKFGVFLDVYAFDDCPKDEKQFKRQAWSTWFWGKLMILRSLGNPVLPMSGWKAKLITAICTVAHYVLKLFCISPKWLYKNLKKNAIRYAGSNSGKVAYMCDTNPFTNTLTNDQIYPLRKVPFEHLEINIPNKMEEMLTVTYGDFMQLPPIEKRKNHFPYQLDLGDYEE